MTLPSKLYDVLKFLVKFIPLVVTFIGAIGKVCGLTDDTVNTILIVIGAVGSLVEGILQICKANHYKIKTMDGTMISIDQYDGDDLTEEQ